MKYFLWNKASDYHRGHMENLCLKENVLKLEQSDGKHPGYYISRMLDAKESLTIWHRLKADIVTGDNMSVRILIYATDSRQQALQTEAMLQNKDPRPLSEKMQQMEELKQLETENPRDIPLHDITGSFLWLGAILWGNGTDSPGIRTLQVFFPKETLNRYLPELYQGEGQEFLERYLSIFQSIYFDMDQKIRKDTEFLDIRASGGEALKWLAQWVHEDNLSLWTEQGLRDYLEESPVLFRQRGTARCLIRMLELFTGEPPYLAEAEEHEEEHYFTIYMREALIADLRSYLAVLNVIRDGKPADMEVRLVPLTPYLFLDQNTYLGINSQLSVYETAVLGTEAAFDFVVLGGGENEEPDLSAI